MRVEKRPLNIFQLLGPGLLFAGAAVGVSHLVLSTKAGANYGFGLLWLVILANLMKYPFFEYGPRYAMATGESLLEGYRRMCKWVLATFVTVTLGTMFTVQAAVTIVTAGLASYIFGLAIPISAWVIILLVICSGILLIGKYAVLDNLMKIIVISLTIITIIAVAIAAIYYEPKKLALSWTQHISFETTALGFYVVFTGWMPAPLDLSVWHSLWTLEKQEATKGEFSATKSFFDFNIGYIGTTILAIIFLSLGALVMYGSGEIFSDKGGEFAGQLIRLYTTTLGAHAAWLVAIAAFITMFSTTITCLDAMPRAMAKAHYLLLDKKETNTAPIEMPKSYYWTWMLVLIIGTLIILTAFTANMGTFITVATILSFVTTPFFAIVNTLLVNSKQMPSSSVPPLWNQILSWMGIVYLLIFTGLYLWSLS